MHQRRYEAVRTYVFEGASLTEVAEQFGYTSLCAGLGQRGCAGGWPCPAVRRCFDDTPAGWCEKWYARSMSRAEKVTVSLPTELLARIEHRRHDRAASRSKIVSELLWRGLSQVEAEEIVYVSLKL